MCQALDASTASYYAWRGRPASNAQRRRGTVLAAIEDIHVDVKGRYDSPRMTAALNLKEIPCSENTADKIMQDNDIRARGPRSFVPRTTDSGHRLPVAENIPDRDFNPLQADQVRSADVTYIPTSEGRLYLAVVEDLFSRRTAGLVDGRDDDEPPGGRCLGHGSAGPPSGDGPADALRPRQSVRQRTTRRCWCVTA